MTTSRGPKGPPNDAGAELVDRLRAALVDVPDVEEKKMFGSQGFMVRGKLCLSARPERIMCRIGAEAHEAALERSGCQTVVMKRREYRGYVYVDASSVSTAADLLYWVELALKHNEALTASGK